MKGVITSTEPGHAKELPINYVEIPMSDDASKTPTKAEQLRQELANLRAALQTAAGGMDEQVQAIVGRMEAILQPAE